MSVSLQNGRLWHVALLAITGCNFSVDANLTKNDIKQEPETSDAGGLCDGLEGNALERCLGVDAGVEPCVEECEPEVRPTECEADAECGDDEICEDRVCAPRCTEERGCASPQITRLSNFDAAGGQVFWSIYNGVDRLGNPLHDGSLWSWDQVGAPVPVPGVTGCDELLFHLDGQLYFRDRGSLFRVASDGATPPQHLADAVVRAWETPDHRIAWSRFAGQAEDLWVLKPDPQEVPEFLGTAPYATSWVASNATHAAWIEWSDSDTEVTIVKLPELEVLDTIPAGWIRPEQVIVMDEKFLYLPQAGSLRVDLQDVTNARIVDGGTGLVASGDWLLWFNWAPSDDQHILAMNDRNAALEPMVVAAPGMRIAGFTISDGAVYYLREGPSPRIFAKSLPAVPCAVDLVCPAEMSCGQDRVCRAD